jgi:hypothetical protein
MRGLLWGATTWAAGAELATAGGLVAVTAPVAGGTDTS